MLPRRSSHPGDVLPAPQEVRRRGGDGGEDGADWISALPDELLLHVLSRLWCLREVIRTSVLSRRWRGLWTGLSKFDFDELSGLDPGSIVTLLTQVIRPSLSWLNINLESVPYRCASSLLRAAVGLAPEELGISLEVNAEGHHAIRLPCFDRTVSLTFGMVGIGVKPPRSGEFAALDSLFLHSMCANPAAVVPMCPRLRVLEIDDCWGLDAVVVHSASLEKLSVCTTNWYINCVDIDAPMLKKLKAEIETAEEFRVAFSAPMVEKLNWACYGVNVGIPGEMWSLERMSENKLHSDYVVSMRIEYCHFRPLDVVRTFAQEIALLPVTNFSVLELDIGSEVHVFGPLVLHLLRIRPSIRRLKVVLVPDRVAESCPPNCPCEHLNNWRSENVGWTDLEDVEIVGFNGNDHEVDFLKLVFRCAIMLKKATVKVSNKALVSNDGYKKICCVYEEYPHVDCYVYSIRSNQVLYP